MQRMAWPLLAWIAGCTTQPLEPALLTLAHPGAGFDQRVTVIVDDSPRGVLDLGCELTIRVPPEGHALSLVWDGGEAQRSVKAAPGESLVLVLDPVEQTLVAVKQGASSPKDLEGSNDCTAPEE